MASIQKRNGRYHVRVRRQDVPSQCKSFRFKADALKWAAKTERAIETDQLFVGEDCTVGDLLDRYKKEITPSKKCAVIEGYRINKLKRRSIAEIRLSKLRSLDVATYRDERLKEVSASTCIRDISLLSNAIHIAIREWGFNLNQNPARQIRLPALEKARERRLVGDEEDRLIEACQQSENEWLMPLVLLAIETAMRRGELLSLRWENVWLDQSFIHLPMTKNGEARDVPLSTKAKAIFQEIEEQIDGVVFPIHFEALKGLWKRAIRRAGIDDLHFHDLRHEAASRFFEKGLNVMEVAAITGHKDLRMLQRYTHLRAEDLAMKLI